MVTFEQNMVIQASYVKVCAVNSDVGGWKKWDPGIEESSIEGPFESGAKGRVKLTKGPVIDIDIVEVTHPEWMAVEAQVKLCHIRFEQNITPSGRDTKVRCKVMLSGPLSSLYGSMVGKKINMALLRKLASLRSFCESRR